MADDGDTQVPGFLTGKLVTGLYAIWMRYNANPETPTEIGAHVLIT